jgi:hypothetical protein
MTHAFPLTRLREMHGDPFCRDTEVVTARQFFITNCTCACVCACLCVWKREPLHHSQSFSLYQISRFPSVPAYLYTYTHSSSYNTARIAFHVPATVSGRVAIRLLDAQNKPKPWGYNVGSVSVNGVCNECVVGSMSYVVCM